jgi:hypothetical protein
MTFILEEKKILLFPNKGSNAKAPTVTGKIKVNDLELRASLWSEGENFAGNLTEGSKATGFKEKGTISFMDADKKSDNAPDKRGSVTVDGKDYVLALWKKVGKNGSFLSGNIQDVDVATIKQVSTDDSDDLF